jgi:hypothetical protein
MLEVVSISPSATFTSEVTKRISAKLFSYWALALKLWGNFYFGEYRYNINTILHKAEIEIHHISEKKSHYVRN